MNDIVEAIKKFNESIEDFTNATKEVTDTNKVIDAAIKKEIKQSKVKAESLLNRIKF